MTKYYRDQSGNYLGAFDGAAPPAGAIEVPTAPAHGRQLWNGSAWSDPPGWSDIQAAEGIDNQFAGGKALRLLFEIEFDQENRLRALELRPPITRAQYRDALIAAWKALP